MKKRIITLLMAVIMLASLSVSANAYSVDDSMVVLHTETGQTYEFYIEFSAGNNFGYYWGSAYTDYDSNPTPNYSHLLTVYVGLFYMIGNVEYDDFEGAYNSQNNSSTVKHKAYAWFIDRTLPENAFVSEYFSNHMAVIYDGKEDYSKCKTLNVRFFYQ